MAENIVQRIAKGGLRGRVARAAADLRVAVLNGRFFVRVVSRRAVAAQRTTGGPGAHADGRAFVLAICGSTRTCRWTTTVTGAWAGRTRCWSSATALWLFGWACLFYSDAASPAGADTPLVFSPSAAHLDIAMADATFLLSVKVVVFAGFWLSVAYESAGDAMLRLVTTVVVTPLDRARVTRSIELRSMFHTSEARGGGIATAAAGLA